MKDPQKAIEDGLLTEAILKTKAHVNRYVITDYEGNPYLERIELGLNQMLHVIYRSDGDRDPHDHPWWFRSQIIHGSYLEHQFDPVCKKWRKQEFVSGDSNVKLTGEFHRLELLSPVVVSLVTKGSKVKDWGFWSLDEDKFIPHEEYLNRKYAGKPWVDVEKDH